MKEFEPRVMFSGTLKVGISSSKKLALSPSKDGFQK